MSVKFFSNLHEYFSSKSPGVFFNGRPAKPVLPDTSVAGAAAGAAQSADMMSSAASTDVVELGESAVELCSNSTPSDLTVEVKDTFILPVTDGELPNVEKKTKKSVKFPEDNGCLVTHYFPATKPFVHSIGSDLDNIQRIAALQDTYMRACRENRVEPLAKAVQQISTWDLTLTHRQENFSLKGEKLTEGQLESLEEIFRHVQFVSLDFEYTFLDDETASIVADLVEYYDSAVKLNLSFNQHIGVRGWQSLLRMIRKSPCLDHLNLRYTSITDRAMPVFSRILRSESSLVTLHLENCSLNGKAMVLLVAALKVNTTVRDLYLAENDIGPKDAVHFYSLILHNTSIQLLDVRNNNLQDAGLSMICDALRNPMCNSHGNLHTLVLWNVKLTHQGMTHLSRALLENKTLETLNLGCNNISSQGIETLKDSITRNRTLTRLGLQGTKLHCPGAIAVAECLADNPVLIRVDLRDNPDIKLAGLLALHLTLKLNTSMTTLNLDKSCIQGPHSKVKDYVEQFQRLYDEIEDFCQRNRKLYLEAVRKKHPSLSNVSSHSDISGDHSQSSNTQPQMDSEEQTGTNESVERADTNMSLSVSKCTDETESVINPIEDDEDFSSDAIESKDAKSRLPRDLSFTCVETVDHICERFAAMPCIKDESEFEVDFCALDEGLDSVGAEVPPTEGSVDTMAESMAKSLTTTGIEEFVTSQLKKVAEQVACVSQSPNNGANLLCKVLPSEETRSQTSSIQAIPSFNPHSQRPSIAKGSPPGPRVTMKQVVSPMRRKFVVSKVPQSEETAVDCQFRRRAVSESATEAVLPSLDLSPMVESIECANELNNNVSKHSVVQFTATTSEKSMVEKTIFLPVSDEIEQLVRDMVAFCIYECGDSQTEKVKILAVDEQSIGEKKQSASDSATDLVVKSIVKDLVNYCVFEQEHEMLLGRATTGRLTLPRSYGRHNQRFAPTRCNAVTTSSSGHVDEPPLLSMPHSRVSAKYAERRRSMDGTNNSLLAIRLKGLQAGKVGSSVGCQTLSKLFNEIPNGVSPPPM